MTNTATSIITAAITAAVVGGMTVYLSSPRASTASPAAPAAPVLSTGGGDPLPPKEHRSVIFIDVDGNNCTSFTFPFQGRVLKNGKVRWQIVQSEDAKKKDCLKNKKLELRPKSGYTSPLDPEIPSHAKHIQATAKTATPDNPAKPYQYEIWLVGGGAQTKLEDPELEIIELR